MIWATSPPRSWKTGLGILLNGIGIFMGSLIKEFLRCVLFLERLLLRSRRFSIAPNGLLVRLYAPMIEILYTPEKVSTLR
jgi:hypothetical protein